MKSDADRRKEAFAWFRDHCDWLRENAHIDVELARGVVRASAVWFRKDVGPVAVPGQAKHVTLGPYGWRIYSSNSFEITLFVKAARDVLLSAYDDAISGKAPKSKDLRRDIGWKAHECVSDFKDDVYDWYTHGDYVLAFGSHGIMALRAAKYLIEDSGYTRALQWVPKRDSQGNPQLRSKDEPKKRKRKSRGPSTHGANSEHSKTERRRREFVEDGLAHARMVRGNLTSDEEVELTGSLFRLARLEIRRSGDSFDATERDRLWAQVERFMRPT